jgi:hypothetical protein
MCRTNNIAHMCRCPRAALPSANLAPRPVVRATLTAVSLKQTVSERRHFSVASPLRTRGPHAIHLSPSRWPVPVFFVVLLCFPLPMRPPNMAASCAENLRFSSGSTCIQAQHQHTRKRNHILSINTLLVRLIINTLLNHECLVQECCFWCVGTSGHLGRSVTTRE